MKRTDLSDHERGILGLSLSLNEFAPAASFSGSTNAHNCSSAEDYAEVYTDFLSPFTWSPTTIVRYVQPESDTATQRTTMTGYGAHLALKRTDYLVIDDSNPTPSGQSSESIKMEPLKMNQMSNIGLRAVSRISKSDDPLAELEDLAQNFPLRASKLLGSKVTKELKDELKDIRDIVRGDIFLVNGVEVVPSPDKLLPVLRAESALSKELQRYGYDNAQVINLLTFDLELPAKHERFDVRSSDVVYLNDFEKDEMYQQWPPGLETFMRPLYPGQFHSIRRNAHTVFANVDLTSSEDRELISNFAVFITRGLPVRWGLIPTTDTPEQALLAKLWREIVDKRGPSEAVEFLAAAAEQQDHNKLYDTWCKRSGASLQESADLRDFTMATEWIQRFGRGSVYTNGRPVQRDESMMQTVSANLRDDTMLVQQMLLESTEFEDTGDLQDYFMGPDANLRYSAALFGPRRYATLAELQTYNKVKCTKPFKIILFGEDWPVGLEEAPDTCLQTLPGPRRMIINGRIIDDLKPSELATLFAQEMAEVDKYNAAAQRTDAPMSSDILALLRSSTTIRTILPKMKSDLTHFTLGNQAGCMVNIDVYVDPLSENAQKWSSILKTLSTIPKVFIRVQLVPKFNIKELPLKRFYRYLLPSQPTFTEQSITFNNLPSDLMVFSLDVWNNWVTSPLYAAVDLDNLHLSNVPIDTEFELSNILVEGHAKEQGDNTPPRGAQLTLSNEAGEITETIIMANLGYFQFKTLPGIWSLQIKEGRSSEIYDLEGRDIEVSKWSGATIYPRLGRKPGQETTEVLNDKEVAGKGSLWSKLKGFGGSSEVVKTGKKHADINIFTVASGHLYERFVYIMISSVMAHTQHSVKFWFISNFLSPQFRQFIPHLAAHLNFEYEMITFTWPHWLRQQTEKQRIIWGYKILFLDVMFPLDLEKVIFVDADQIVRTDMIELINEDLKGKVWGYTPMCDSRKEIEGFRFWKQGYWKDFLRGKPYHISALYVIDLVAFRSQATGDRLRQQYHQLSADPASLSNLDQDLPNHLQAQIPIHSLSQEWLWCETWCSDESLKDAKTIDLCQNPMTKEPKLERARRQLPEWNEYDRKIKEFAKSIAQQQNADAIGSIVVDVDKVGQNLEMKKDQLGDAAIVDEQSEEADVVARDSANHDEL